MPICIECCYPVSQLYTSYSKADDRSLGKGVRLTQCPRCKRFADKYVEHDFVVLFIDLVLIKHQVYRHLLFNRLGREDNKFDRSIIRLGILTLLFDVYLSWARLEKSSALASSPLSSASIVVQYLFFLALNAAATLAHHVVVRMLAAVLVPSSSRGGGTTIETKSGDISPSSPSTPIPPGIQSQSTASLTSPSPPRLSRAPSSTGLSSQANLSSATLPPPPRPQLVRRSSTIPLRIQPMPPPALASPNAISTALLVSSCTKLFPILLVIWGPENPDPSNTGTTSLSTTFSPKNPITRALSNAASKATSAATSPAPTPSAPVTSFFSSLSSAILDPILSVVLSITNTHLVLLNNVEALSILLDCGYVRASTMALGGQAARYLVERTMLAMVGL